MFLKALGVSHLRNLISQRLELGPGINAFIGPNGSGKTSLLEGAYLLSHGQSFRPGPIEALISRSAERMELAACIVREGGSLELKLSHSPAGWNIRVNGSPAPTLASLLREFALVCFEPGSHALISGGSRERRHFLDWGVFHVEPDFWVDMRHYNRVLRQRNAALKQSGDDSALGAWDLALVERAGPVFAKRRTYFEHFAQEIGPVLMRFLPELGEPELILDDGCSGVELAEALRARRALDLVRGHTSRGPHRADWRIRFPGAPCREHLSRGQEKLCAVACVLAQAITFSRTTGEWPVIALDDLASELDLAHQAAVVEFCVRTGAQVLVTGTDLPAALKPFEAATRMFHVEHGRVTALL